jgi:hypothetical protein
MARGGYVSEDDFEDGIFGEPHRDTIRSLRDRIERYAPRASQAFSDFFDDARQTFEKYNGRAALRRIRETVNRVRDPLRRNSIRELRTIEEFQKAKPRMQEFLMCSPLARRMEFEQRMDAYSDSMEYFNPEPGRRGWNDPVFRRVFDGLIQEDNRWGIGPDDDETRWIAMQDIERDEHDVRALDVGEQKCIVGSLDFFEIALAAGGLDPSNTRGERL